MTEKVIIIRDRLYILSLENRSLAISVLKSAYWPLSVILFFYLRSMIGRTRSSKSILNRKEKNEIKCSTF